MMRPSDPFSCRRYAGTINRRGTPLLLRRPCVSSASEEAIMASGIYVREEPKSLWKGRTKASPPPGPDSGRACCKGVPSWRLLYVLLVCLISLCSRTAAERKREREALPEFLEPVRNVTVAVGRDASLSCVVDHLGQHKVAWVHLDRKMIVAIHKQVVSRIQRFSVTHDSHKTWTIHVSQVEKEDKGSYMCQVNTTPMISQEGYLDVVVPPNILDDASSGSNLIVRERDNVTLRCVGDGSPDPQIRWMREDARTIPTAEGKKVEHLEGEELVLKSVSREHMGAYLCIASNGVPPSVSKRITLEVEFPPQMHVPNQLIGVALGTEVKLECQVEASPKPVTYWSHSGVMVSNSSRIMSEIIANNYHYTLLLTIRDVVDSDFGSYLCIAKNSFSETNGSIKLNKILRPTRPPQINPNQPFPDRRVNFDQNSSGRRIPSETTVVDASHRGSYSNIEGVVKGDLFLYEDGTLPEPRRRNQQDKSRRVDSNLSFRPLNNAESAEPSSASRGPLCRGPLVRKPLLIIPYLNLWSWKSCFAFLQFLFLVLNFYFI